MAYAFQTSIAVAAAALVVAACDARTNRTPVPADLAAAAAPPAYLDPYASAPLPPLPPLSAPVSATAPQTRAASWSPADRYRYIDRAYGMSYAFDDLPPDYVFDYGGVDPWVWQASNGGSWIVEPLDYGERYYYYEPGAYLPFFVRDPDYGYAYDNGVLVQVYDSYGRPWASDYAPWMRERASRYRDRGRNVYYAARRSPRLQNFGVWEARRPRLDQQARVWAAQQTRDDGWRQWRNAPPARAERAVWEQERSRRRNRQIAFDADRAGPRGAAHVAGPQAFARQDPQRWSRQAPQHQEARRDWQGRQFAEQQGREQQRGWERRAQMDQARQQQESQRRSWRRQPQQAEPQQRAQREQQRGWERRAQMDQAREQRESQRRGWRRQSQQAEQQQRAEREQQRGWERRAQMDQARQQQENPRRGWEQQRQQVQQQQRAQHEQARQQRRAQMDQGRQQQQQQQQRGWERRAQKDQQRQAQQPHGGGGRPQQVARNDRPDHGDRGHGRRDR